MKAAVLYSKGERPQFVDFPEPAPGSDEEVLVSVKAVALKHLDKSRAKGTHYSTGNNIQEAKVIGGDGVIILPDGSRAYALGVSGMMAEKATVEKHRIVPIPAGLDDLTAAALPNAVFGAAMALRFRAGIEPGDTVLINGATGFTGRVAVQIAKHYGAGRIIVTGRNARSLQELLTLGADEIVSLPKISEIQSSQEAASQQTASEQIATQQTASQQADQAFITQLQDIHRITPINVIIDYLWGHPAELILASIKGNGSFSGRTRFVSVGAMTGDLIQLSAANLRSIDLQLSGSGLGSWTKKQVSILFAEILPGMFQLAAKGKLKIETTPVLLKDIEKVWEMDVPDGKRLVVQI